MVRKTIIKAKPLYQHKVVAGDRVLELVVWQLPDATPDRPHGLKYRLYCGMAGECVVRYDNEVGKGDHRHYGEREERYRFTGLHTLIQDFLADVKRLTGLEITL